MLLTKIVWLVFAVRSKPRGLTEASQARNWSCETHEGSLSFGTWLLSAAGFGLIACVITLR